MGMTQENGWISFFKRLTDVFLIQIYPPNKLQSFFMLRLNKKQVL